MTPGFADPVADSQTVFRAVLDATSRPGTLRCVRTPAEPPPALHRATAAVLLTLADADTPVWLDEAASAAWAWVAFHCGAPAAPAADAVFAVATDMPDLQAFHAGTDETPEQGVTVVLQVAALGEGRPWLLSGPGLLHEGTLQVQGLPDGFATMWARNAALFPRGVDLVLCAGDTLAALPRTVSVREG